MRSYIYSAWFLDKAAFKADQDREWVACFAIEAADAQEARKWGDVLASERGRRFTSEQFINSSVELEGDSSAADLSNLPRIRVGERASDILLGW